MFQGVRDIRLDLSMIREITDKPAIKMEYYLL